MLHDSRSRDEWYEKLRGELHPSSSSATDVQLEMSSQGPQIQVQTTVVTALSTTSGEQLQSSGNCKCLLSLFDSFLSSIYCQNTKPNIQLLRLFVL